jgi:hypothetical protein
MVDPLNRLLQARLQKIRGCYAALKRMEASGYACDNGLPHPFRKLRQPNANRAVGVDAGQTRFGLKENSAAVREAVATDP